MRSAVVWMLGAVLVATVAAPAPADDDPIRLLRERPDDPYLPPPAIVDVPRPLPLPAGGADFGVQVNTDPFGANIPGDAANEPSIAVDPTAPNRMVIGWRQFDTIQSNFRQAGWGYSHDGGRTWTFPGVLTPGVFRSDPVLGADADGTIYYCSLMGNFSVQFFKSFDGGVSWGAPLAAFGGDKQWFSIDRTAGSGHGHIYMSWNTAAGCCGSNIFTRSTDGGSSFMTPIGIFGSPIFGNNDIDSTGALFVGGLTSPYNPSVFLCARSDSVKNAQAQPAFEQVAVVDMGGSQVLGADPNPVGLLGQANVSVDTSGGPTEGNVYMLCSVDPPGADPLDVMFARSTDGGLSWSPPVRVNDDSSGAGAWQWMGTMSVAPNGRIDAVWLDTRGSGLAQICELYYAFSTDAGASWSPNTVMSPSFNSHLGWPNQNKMGDYFDMVSDRLGANLAYAATFNGEQDVYFLRIGDHDCNGNGVADADDIALSLSGDCNQNSIPDECEIAAGTSADSDGNGIPDECVCTADLDGSQTVDVLDLLAMLAVFGDAAEGPPDLNGNGVVDIVDVLLLLAQWGTCLN